jgi:putative ABC transport system permease protein
MSIEDLNLIKERLPEIIAACAVNKWDNSSDRSALDFIYYSVIDEKGYTIELTLPKFDVTDGFLAVFNPEIIMGDASRIFISDNNVMLNKTVALKFFDKEYPVGKTLTMTTKGENTVLTVVAVCEDFSNNCSLENGIYSRLPPYIEAGFSIYFKIPESQAKVAAKRIKNGEHLRIVHKKSSYYIFPLTEIYFSKAGAGNLTTSLSLLFVGIVAMIIAWINFINFSVAMAPSRVKSLNIQKIFGANSRLLRIVLASEPAVFAFIAFLLAVFFMNIIHKNLANDFFSADLSVANHWQLIVVAGIFTVFSGFIIGLYPAYYISSFKPIVSLSSSLPVSKKNVNLQNVLTVIQFTTAIILITVVVFIKYQHFYVTKHDWGMQTQNIVYMPVNDIKDVDKVNFITELKKNPQILDYTSSDCLPGKLYREVSRSIDAAENLEPPNYMHYTIWYVSENFSQFFNIPVVEGYDFFNTPTKSHDQLIVNKKIAEQVPDIVGRMIGIAKVVGVAENINFKTLHHPIEAMGFYKEGDNTVWPWLFLKIQGSETKRTIAYIKNAWEKFSNRPFELNFLDKHLSDLYKKENNLANLLTIAGIIAIIIAIMGVYGLLTLNIRKKEKEIALRKICGASLKDILLLLNRGALIQLVLSFVVAVPVAYFITNRWLETFAYKISVHWWIFVLCWLIICIITIATICMQTYRAAIKNPVEALKTE